MEIKYTEEELNSIDKSLLIKVFLNLQNQMETLTVETKALNDKMQKMMYRSGYMYPDEQIVLYEYQRTRNASHPRQFLKDYYGVCVTDGYQVYHTVDKELEDLRIDGCWVHCRRKFDEALKAVPKAAQKESFSYLVIKQIQAVYREEDKLKELKPK